ncbi:hypothetical protein BD311DRAFT_866904 [Dichomitus squalens]|uniref:Uncharacterized protein n=1 Tax=Dichomitus squalens TaxID=114155 RepID=A0A4Q9MJ75_9APHY|nr:hypothetical protein BD311DRAFT_866904 [Dichomitus squalens]
MQTRDRTQSPPVGRLPPEVLSDVFDLVRRGHLDGMKAHDGAMLVPPDNRSLIVVTHVSRQWREIALQYTTLWTDIVITSPTAATFLRRSRRLPLTIFVTGEREELPPLEEWRSYDLHVRIRGLYIELEDHSRINSWQAVLQILADSLEGLTIVIKRPRRRPMWTTSLALSLFGSKCPASLRSLSISSRMPIFPTDHFPALQHASLSEFDCFPIRLELLAHFLLNAPALQTFHLHIHPTSRRTHSVHPDLSPIVLPCMRRLCIALPLFRFDPMSEAAHIAVQAWLANLVVPKTAAVSLREAPYANTVSCCDLPLYLPPTLGPSPTSALSIDDQGTAYACSGNSQTIHFAYAQRLAPERPGSSAGPAARAPLRAQMVRALGSVRILRIHSPRDAHRVNSVYQDSLARLLPYMPHLTELVVRDVDGETLVQLVWMLTRSEPVLCPGLASVTYITLGASARHLDAQGSATHMLFEAGARRALLGRAFKRLTYCCPENAQELTLQNTHGVERILVTNRDVWAEYDCAFDEEARGCCAAHMRSFERTREPGLPERPAYASLWKAKKDVCSLEPPPTFTAWNVLLLVCCASCLLCLWVLFESTRYASLL